MGDSHCVSRTSINMHPWCQQMVDTYNLKHMCTYPYDPAFGVDGPDGNAIYGEDAERVWRELYYQREEMHPWCQQMVDTYSLEHMCTFPYDPEFGVDGPDGNALYGRDAEDMWRDLYYAWSSDSCSSSSDEKPPKGGDKWCKKMIKIYGLSHMTTFPYDEAFGIDGPYGAPLWGAEAEDVFKSRYDPWCLPMVQTYSAEHMCTFPYDPEFGVDGPDGEPMYGKKVKREWKKRGGGTNP